jgi:hypothetical protein
VLRSDGPEVPAIQGGDLRLSELLARRDHGGVDEPEVERGIRAFELGSAGETGIVEMMDAIRTASDVVDEREPDVRSVELDQPVVDLDQDRCGNDEVLGETLDRGHAALVLGIGGIEQGNDRASVENQRQSGSAPAPAGGSVLVLGDGAGGGAVSAHDAKARSRPRADPVSLSLDGLPQQLGQRHAATPRLLLQHREVVFLRG